MSPKGFYRTATVAVRIVLILLTVVNLKKIDWNYGIFNTLSATQRALHQHSEWETNIEFMCMYVFSGRCERFRKTFCSQYTKVVSREGSGVFSRKGRL